MADLAAFSIERGPPALPAKRTWSSVEYALGLLGFMAFSAAMVMILDYKRLEGSLKLWASLEQPDFFRPAPDESLLVRRTIVEGAAEKGAGFLARMLEQHCLRPLGNFSTCVIQVTSAITRGLICMTCYFLVVSAWHIIGCWMFREALQVEL